MKRPVRCNVHTPTTYLAKNEAQLRDDVRRAPWGAGLLAADIGCGNGRNSEFLKRMGWRVISFDGKPDYGAAIRLGEDKLQVWDHEAFLVLLQYVLMFLNAKERRQLMEEAKRITNVCGKILVELYPAKDSFTPTQADVDKLQKELLKMFGKGWVVRHNVRNRFIVERRLPTA